MKKILGFVVAATVLALGGNAASAQQMATAKTIASCGGQSLNVGQTMPMTMDLTGDLCTVGGSSSSPTYVTGNVGGFDSGTSPTQTATPANSSHTAGQSVGGLYSIPTARTAGGGGQLEQFMLISVGGDTPTLQVRLWDRKPTNSSFACTDNAAYAAGSGSTGGTVPADQAHLLTPPFTVTLAAPGTTTGDAYTYGSYSFVPPLSFKNQDGTTTQNVYACLEATVTYTPTALPYIADAMGAQD